MSLKTALFALGALALGACADPTEPTRIDAEMLLRAPLPTPWAIFDPSGDQAGSPS